MARPRFYYVRRAEDLTAAKTALEAWERKTQAEKKALYQTQITNTGNKRSDRGRVLGYIMPFGIDVAKKVYLKVWLLASTSADPNNELTPSEESAASMITDLTAIIHTGTTKYATTIEPTGVGNYILDYRKQMRKLASVSVTQKEGASKTLTSRITQMEYSYRKSNSVSCTFGQIVGTDTEMFIANKSIEALVEVANAQYSTTFKPQGNLNIGVTTA